MTAQAAETETFEDEYEEFDDFDNDGEERGLSGLVVLLMGVVMLGAFASVVWIAYQQGIKTGGGERSATPYVVADPDPVKIENRTADAASADNERAVYDRIEGNDAGDVEVLAEGPEEPVARDADDPIAAIASNGAETGAVDDDAVADRITSLAEADAALTEDEIPAPPEQTAPAQPAPSQPAASQPAAAQPAPARAAASGAGALSGTHLVQVGAFGSNDEAAGQWARLQGKLGDYLSGKSYDVQVADLGEKGVFHRLRIGPFASSDAANEYCEGLKSRGQSCFPVAK